MKIVQCKKYFSLEAILYVLCDLGTKRQEGLDLVKFLLPININLSDDKKELLEDIALPDQLECLVPLKRFRVFREAAIVPLLGQLPNAVLVSTVYFFREGEFGLEELGRFVSELRNILGDSVEVEGWAQEEENLS